MITLFLHGRLRAFAAPFQIEAQTAAEAVHGLAAQCEGLADMLQSLQLRLISGPRKTGRLINGPECFAPLGHPHLHLVPVIAGRGRDNGKMVLGMTLIGLSFVPGLSAGIAGQFASAGNAVGGAHLAQAGQFLGSHLLGSAGAFLMQSAISDSFSPQKYSPAGTHPSALISPPQSSAQGQPIPLIYGQVSLRDPIVISSSLIVETQSL